MLAAESAGGRPQSTTAAAGFIIDRVRMAADYECSHAPMKISRKAEYALRALAVMGRAPVGTTFSIQEISSSERIPLKFLEQILVILKNAGLLRSRRGVGGGYRLNRPPSEINLLDVVSAVDGPVNLMSCAPAAAGGRNDCECGLRGGCSLGRTFADLQQRVRDWMSVTTVADVIARDPAEPAVSFEI